MQREFPNNNLYKELGLPNFVSLVDIKKRFRELSLRYHPDRPAGDHKKMCALNNILDMFIKHKEEYDNHLKMQLGQVGQFRVIITTSGMYYDNASTTATWTQTSTW